MAQLFTFALGTTGKSATVGYQFFDEAGSSLGARSTTGVGEFGTTGIYYRSQALPAGAVAVVWNDTDTGGAAVDDTIALPSMLTTIDDFLDTEIAAIKAKTDNLPADPADASDIAAATNAIAGYIDTEVAAIKAKTDLIPANPAAVGDIPTATENADALLNRDMSAVSDTNARSPLNALRFLRNKWSTSGTALTVTKEDDTTSAWTSTLTTNASADPITGNDPA